MFKNLSPSRLTYYISALVSLFNVIIGLLFSIINGVPFNISLLLISALASFFICFLIVRYFISSYLIKKINLIYDIIQRSKYGKSSDITPDQNLLKGNVWQSVEGDVAKWATMTEAEIQNLKRLEQYRKDFLGTISHELKTPIFSIQGYIHTLLDGGLEDPSVNVHFLRRASDNIERLITIVDDLESISHLESGVVKLEIAPFSVGDLVLEVISDLKVQAKQNETKFLYDSKTDNFLVKGDRERYRQVFNNLILNSIKYGKKGGETGIKIIDLSQYILVEVSDNGIGIEERHLTHLFDRFYRVDKSRSREVGGSGLGLSIVKHIIEAHNQTINVRSVENEGSAFGFTIEKAN